LVRYYFRAKDNLNNTTLVPNVPGQIPALFYTSRVGGCIIRDIQFTPYPTGRSGYVGDTLILQGIVTASAASGNLGYVFIQQENQNEWARQPLTINHSPNTSIINMVKDMTGMK
jgi:hypothetical protein